MNVQLRNRWAARRSGGFTLIELLLVLVIIAILATVVATRFTGTTEKAKTAKAKADIGAMKTALQIFETDNSRLPTSEEGLQALVANPAGLPDWKAGGYLDGGKVPLDPWGRAYIYRQPGTEGKDYDLLSTGPSGQEGNADNIGM